jgi:N,N'-diacetyllegionaminate synthase
VKRVSKPIIIAEVGECFNGDRITAVKLIGIAAKAGCDIVKFQTLDAQNVADDDPERAWFLKISLDPAMIRFLVAAGRRAGIEVMFTPENVKTCSWLVDSGLKMVKVASSCAHDGELLTYINRNFDTVFMSTGMAELDEIDTAVRRLRRVKRLYILHCISEYPTGPLLEKRGLRALAPADVRMHMMTILMKRYPKHAVGYSDHTAGLIAPIVATSLGAAVIEKHVTLDRSKPMRNFRTGKQYLGTDHVLSLEPDELAQMVALVREAALMLGPDSWQRSEGEVILKDFLRSRFTSE